jgi:superfamily II DNA or RNA helicase
VQLLDECAAHWNTYKTSHPRAKLLVVTANIEDAKKYVAHLLKNGIRAAIATSDDSAQAQSNIEAFKSHGKRKSLDALVTVAMAYEGLDVPAVTHIACLTHIRSKPWIEQMIARATRFDSEAGPWEEQMAYIYVPDDRNMCGIIQSMQDEQITAVKQAASQDDLSDEQLAALMNAERSTPEERNAIVPVGSQGAGRRWNRVGHVTPNSSTQATPTRTPSEQEAALREQIQDYCKRVDLILFERKWGETNKRVVKYFGKPRTVMTLVELKRVVAWLEEQYPLGTVTTTSRTAV